MIGNVINIRVKRRITLILKPVNNNCLTNTFPCECDLNTVEEGEERREGGREGGREEEREGEGGRGERERKEGEREGGRGVEESGGSE